MQLSEKHHSVITSGDIAAICEPLFKLSGLTAFLYARIFDDHRTYSLISNPIWQLHHFKKEYKVSPPIPEELVQQKFHYLALPNTADVFQQTIYDFRNLLDIDYPLVFIERSVGYYDLYLYATHTGNANIINFYLSQLSILEKFKFYFKEKAQKLIQKATQHTILLPPPMWPTISGLNNSSRPEINTPHNAINIFSIKNYEFSHPTTKQRIFLTKREREVVKQLILGYTQKEAGKNMHISPRTVETYLNNIKNKLGCEKKSEIISLLFSDTFFHNVI